MTATIILVTAWLKRRGIQVTHAETQPETEHETEDEINDEFGKYETQKLVGVIGHVWVSAAEEKFHLSRSCYGLRHTVRFFRKTACECCVKGQCGGNGR